jgi:hypothetical protein
MLDRGILKSVPKGYNIPFIKKKSIDAIKDVV